MKQNQMSNLNQTITKVGKMHKATVLFFSLFTINLLITLPTIAQFSKGTYLIGGGLFSQSSKSKSSTSVASIKGSVSSFDVLGGTAIKENIFVGGAINIVPEKYSNYNYSGTIANIKSTGIAVGAFGRMYKKIGKDFYFFTQGIAAYLGTKQKVNDTTKLAKEISNTNSSGILLTITPGISYKIFKNFYLELTIPRVLDIEYKTTKQKIAIQNNRTITQKDFYFNSSLNESGLSFIGVGFKYIFKR